MQHKLKHQDTAAKGEDEYCHPTRAKCFLGYRESFFTNHASVQEPEGYCENWPLAWCLF